MGNLQFIQEKTKDGLTLPGFHWPTTTKRCCVLMVHGMYSNLFENQFAIALANQLPTLGIGFFYGHNRGYGFINSIPTDRLDKDGSFINQRLGTVYERFEDSLLDLQLWLTTIQNLGYSSIILCGHSLGCNKILYYLANRPATMVDGIILASAPDMVHLGQQGANAQVLSEEAQQYVAKGQGQTILSHLLWEKYPISAQTFCNLFLPGSTADNLPIAANPAVFPSLAKIQQPILAILGALDMVIVRSAAEDLALLKAKSVSCPSFHIAVIPDANHRYGNQEVALAQTITTWLQQVLLKQIR